MNPQSRPEASATTVEVLELGDPAVRMVVQLAGVDAGRMAGRSA